jgi:Enoyl-(Acyl carrier protein) reductase
MPLTFEDVEDWTRKTTVLQSLQDELSQRSPAQDLLQLPFITEVTEPGLAYGVAKRANRIQVQAASKVWGERGARINSISPGIISTPMGQEELASPPWRRDAADDRRLGGRQGGHARRHRGCRRVSSRTPRIVHHRNRSARRRWRHRRDAALRTKPLFEKILLLIRRRGDRPLTCAGGPAGRPATGYRLALCESALSLGCLLGEQRQ